MRSAWFVRLRWSGGVCLCYYQHVPVRACVEPVCCERVVFDKFLLSLSQLPGLFARPPDRVELIDAGFLGYGTGPSFG